MVIAKPLVVNANLKLQFQCCDECFGGLETAEGVSEVYAVNLFSLGWFPDAPK